MSITLNALPDSHGATMEALQRVATHVLARARHTATGRFGLRATPGGFGTPSFGPEATRLRVSAGRLLRETTGADGASTTAIPLDGASLAELAAFAGVDVTAAFSAGHDTVPMGEPDARLVIDPAALEAMGEWFHFVATVLDDVIATRPRSDASVAQLWPEHFDLALDLAATPAIRVNVGGSPGDGHSAQPYLYVGPWTGDRPGGSELWDAPFGATLPYEALTGRSDARAVAGDFIGSRLDALGRA